MTRPAFIDEPGIRYARALSGGGYVSAELEGGERGGWALGLVIDAGPVSAEHAVLGAHLQPFEAAQLADRMGAIAREAERRNSASVSGRAIEKQIRRAARARTVQP